LWRVLHLLVRWSTQVDSYVLLLECGLIHRVYSTKVSSFLVMVVWVEKLILSLLLFVGIEILLLHRSIVRSNMGNLVTLLMLKRHVVILLRTFSCNRKFFGFSVRLFSFSSRNSFLRCFIIWNLDLDLRLRLCLSLLLLD